uniref:Tubulin tyrosine ligase-like family, member 6 n=1 Tax=Cyprinus carpio carpio TaxID=630221 RepID=A0A9J7YFS9_CYPCA
MAIVQGKSCTDWQLFWFSLVCNIAKRTQTTARSGEDEIHFHWTDKVVWTGEFSILEDCDLTASTAALLLKRSYCLKYEFVEVLSDNLNHVIDSYNDFQAYTRAKKHKTYICKPDSGCQGRGICLTKSNKDIRPGEHMICQVYISKPFIIDGFKFDLRICVLVTSCDPFRIFMFKLVRFTGNNLKSFQLQEAHGSHEL